MSILDRYPLRTVPRFVTAHTFCASRVGICLLIQVFCAVYDYLEKEYLSKGYQSPKRKLKLTAHFSEII